MPTRNHPLLTNKRLAVRSLLAVLSNAGCWWVAALLTANLGLAQVAEPIDLPLPGGVVLPADVPTLPVNEAAPQILDEADGESSVETTPLSIADVIASTLQSFPAIEQARLQRNVTSGEILSAFGSYDTKLYGYSLNEPVGFYHNFRQGLGVARQTWWGGYVSAGYRIGRGDFQPWYEERDTNGSGEFKVTAGIPLLQGRAIDPQRVAVFQANLGRRAAEPEIQLTILNVAQEATTSYWEWVAAGMRLKAQEELLELAEIRQEQLEEGAAAGFSARIEVTLNRSILAKRKSDLIKAQQKFRDAAFKLSIFLRDDAGSVILPDALWAPTEFPIIETLPPFDLAADLAAATARRPELMLLSIEQQQIELERRLALNQRLPRIDLISEASQDLGTETSSKNDKGQFELLIGVQGYFDIQQRKATGKAQSTSGKIQQLSQKIRLQINKIEMELRMAYNALAAASDVVQQAEIGAEAALRSAVDFRFAFEEGYQDLIKLNIQEIKANEAEILWIDARRDWFLALARLQAVLALDPFEQAQNVASLPADDPMPTLDEIEGLFEIPEDFDAEWERLLEQRNGGAGEPNAIEVGDDQ
ncbi:MAG: TolC family protein [Planctomycetota bacterium]